MADNIVYSGDHYDVVIPQRPHVPKSDGGHIMVCPRRPVSEFFELTEDEAIAIMHAVRQVTKGMFPLMKDLGHPLYTVNVQDNGNWAFLRGEAKSLHFHIYGRALDEVHQEYGKALTFHGPKSRIWDMFEPLEARDGLKALAYGGPVTSGGFEVSIREDGKTQVSGEGGIEEFDSFDEALDWANSQGAEFRS